MSRVSLLLATVLISPSLSLGCVDSKQDPDAKPNKSAEGSNDAAANQEPVSADTASAGTASALTAEELELIEADIATLTPEQKRKRAYAMRKKIMQDPSSPQAQALEDARTAALNGDLSPEQVDPENGAKDPGLVIELPEHLKDQRVSKGEPALE